MEIKRKEEKKTWTMTKTYDYFSFLLCSRMIL